MRRFLFCFLVLAVIACKKNRTGNNNPQPALQFKGDGGVYYLSTADIPVPASVFQNSSVSGVVIRFKWETIEPSPGNFNWAFIDGEIAKARTGGKKVSLQPLGYPSWVISSLGAATYWYIDKNSFHSTFGDTLQDVISWNAIYLSRVKLLIDQLAARYAGDTSVAYCNMIAGQISRGLPDSIVTATGAQPFYQAFAYHADTLVAKMKILLDHYMTVFTNTPLWNSIDYVTFEPQASGRPINYLASQYAAYGIQKYPDRFGCWREDLSGCNPQPSIQPTSHWSILQQNPVRTGAQMLWSVQDGPSRMNKCGISPNTEVAVLDSAVNNGLRLGMRYIEIYGSDISDPSLGGSIQQSNDRLRQKIR